MWAMPQHSSTNTSATRGKLFVFFCQLFVLQICTHSDFELIVLLMIFGNCISLAAYDPIHHDGPRNQMLEKIGAPLTALHLHFFAFWPWRPVQMSQQQHTL
jgi:hypothetical protein